MRINEIVCDCPGCGKKFRNTSPQTPEAYETGLITIEIGAMLLPPAVVALNHKDGVADVRVADISGDYCSVVCLVKKLNAVLHLDGGVKKPEDLDTKIAEAAKEADRRAREREEQSKKITEVR